MKKEIRILVKGVGKPWEERTVKNTLPALQGALDGGYLEWFDHEGLLGFYCDEEGRLKGLEPNVKAAHYRCPIRGTVLGIRVDDDDEFTDLEAGDLELAMKKFPEADDVEAAAE